LAADEPTYQGKV
jgi:glycylpeptide N-tetradecanoyltransferase